MSMSEHEETGDSTAHRTSKVTRDLHDSDVTAAFAGPEPQRIGEYQLIRRIGGGGMGVVYEALHARLKKRVAVKLLCEPLVGKQSAWRRFFREMEAVGKLEHPHVVRATDAGEANGVPYLVMEYIDGADLSRLV